MMFLPGGFFSGETIGSFDGGGSVHRYGLPVEH